MWLRSTGRRIKSPLPLHSGLRLRVRSSLKARLRTARYDVAAFEAMACRAEAAERRRLVAPRGFDPRFPAYRAGALATRRRGNEKRDGAGTQDLLRIASRAAVFRPLVGRVLGGKGRRGVPGTRCAQQDWYLLRDSNPGSRGVGAELWPLS